MEVVYVVKIVIIVGTHEGSATIRFGVRDLEITDFKHGFPDFSYDFYSDD